MTASSQRMSSLSVQWVECEVSELETKGRRMKVINWEDRQFPCAQCPKRFSIARNLKRHLKVHEKNQELAKLAPVSFQCDQCPKNYPTKRKLKRHTWMF